ncbi:restriction endonuclease subunit S [Verrucomicrobiales bacterium]|nr:restriction endonuclease subunit S [Verrucomicrobiales bacterium]
MIEKPLDGNHGGTHPKSKDYVPEGIPFVMASDMIGGRVDTTNCKFITKEQADSLRKGFAKTGDVLLSHKATIGRTAVVKETVDDYVMLTPQVTYYRVKDRDRLNNKYLRYYFDSAPFQELFNQWAGGGSTRAYLGITGQLKLPIVLPPLPEQKAIAHILGTLDDKIELNRRMNATLEGMAQALFKSWFVDFDPVIDNALAAGNPIPDELAPRAEVRKNALANSGEPGRTNGTTQQGSLDHPTLSDPNSLFPAAFQFTEELGWIPKGWEVRPLDKIAHYQNGLALQKFRPKDGETPMPVVKIAQLKTGESSWDETASPSIKPECILNDGDVVFSWSGSLMVTLWCGGQAALNQHLFKVTSQDYPKWFFLEWTKKHLEDFQRIAADKAVTMGHIKRIHLSEAMCLVPSATLIQEGSRIIPPIIDRLISNELESRTLTKLRDTLLPKLISGELRLPEAEQLTEEALNV